MKSRLLRFLPIIVVVFVIIIAYGQTVRMYFWQDDSALIFKLQHQAEAAGSFGVGLWERSPYQYLVVPFVPVFNLFKLEPFGYFLVGFLSYFVVTFFFWLFSLEIFQEKKHAYISTLIFAAGYVGSDIMFRVINSWQTNIGLVLALITMKLYVRYQRSLKLKHYILALLFFLITIEAVYIRSHSLIFSICAIDIFFSLPFKNLKKLFALVIRQIPFWTLFYIWYLKGEAIGTNSFGAILAKVLHGQFGVFMSLFATVGNALVPDLLQGSFMNKFAGFSHFLIFLLVIGLGYYLISLFNKNPKIKITFLVSIIISFLLNIFFYSQDLLWYRGVASEVSGFVGLSGFVISIFLSIAWWKKNHFLAVGVILGYIILISQAFGYFVQYPESIFGTTHRYLSNAFVGYSLLYGSIFSGFLIKHSKSKLVSLLPLIILLTVNLYLGFRYQRELVNLRSVPTRKFYQDLKKFVPTVSKGDIFYFDVERNGLYEKQFGDFFSVGSMPETTALAIYYNVDRYDISMFTDFDELVANLPKGNSGYKNIHTFFYGKNGLENTTELTKKLLILGADNQRLNISGNTLQGEISTLTPQQINLNMILFPSPYPKFPYSFSSGGNKSLTLEKKIEMLKYLVSRESYYKTIKITSLSEWKYREVNYAVDNDFGTAWQSHRTRWDEIKDDNLTVDLGNVRNINKLYWTNWKHSLTPSNYEVSISIDGQNWKTVKLVQNGPERKDNEVVVEVFDNSPARFVKMKITKTVTDDSPAVSEFEVVDSNFNADLNKSLSFLDNPFGYVRDKNEWDTLYKYLNPLVKLSVLSYTNKENSKDTMRKLPVFLDNKIHNYDVIIPQSGILLDKFELMMNFPVEIKIFNASAKNLSLEDLRRRGLIKVFSQN